MRLEDSMCLVVQKVKDGDEDAVCQIWNRYFPQIVRLAGKKLTGQRRQAADEEDVAISVMESFLRAAQAGRFPDLNDRDGIWRLLARMTSRKVIDLIRKNAARPVVGESALGATAYGANPLVSLPADDPTPEVVAMVADEVQHLFEVLPEKYHAVALAKIECLTAPEIALQCGIHVSTVERRLRIIREIWAKEFGNDGQLAD